MDRRELEIEAGWPVYGQDGERLGEIDHVGADYVVVARGFLLPTDVYVPMSAIREVDRGGRRVVLDVDRLQIPDMGWNAPPDPDAPFGVQVGAAGATVEGLGFSGRGTAASPSTDDRAD